MKSIWKYEQLLPKVGSAHQLSIGEGGTPLARSKNIGPSLGLKNLYFKLENLNPSGSYKDRFAALALSQIQEQGVGFCLATSSGNTGAALAAYSAVAHIPCFLAIVDGAPEGKLTQMRAYGAETLMVRDFGKDAEVTQDTMTLLEQIALSYDSVVQVSAFRYSPSAMQGVQTIAYEIAEQLGQEKVQVFVPAGGGGLTLAICKGIDRWAQEYQGYVKPTIHCVQPEGNDTIATAIRNQLQQATAIATSTTAVSGLQVPGVLDGDEVLKYCMNNAGMGHTVKDEEVFAWQQRLALEEGIFCEPAGAVALAGLANALKNKEIDTAAAAVCIVTGHGFKDPVSVQRMASASDLLYMGNIAEMKEYITRRIK